jgi:cell division septation protein DedD
MVGKRVEARSHVGRAATSATRDPLAALDQLDATSRGAQLSFQKALTAAPAPAGQVEKAIAELDRIQTDEPGGEAVGSGEEPAAKEPPKAAAVKEAKEPAKEPAKEAARPREAVAAKEPSKEAAKAKEPAKDASKGDKSRYTLQLSSFQDRSEAEAFMGTLTGAGYKPYLVQSEVEGKGTYYRVRVGGYPSYDDAMAAKADFENKVQRIAYVTKL